MGQLLLIAVRNLAQHRKRTLMLGGAIAGVTALLVVLLGLSAGVRATMLESATTLASGHLNVGGFFKVTAGQAGALVTDFPKVVKLLQREIPEVAYVSSRGRGWARLVGNQASMQVGLGGIDVMNEPGFRKVVQVRQGRLDDLSQPNTLMLFEEQARKLGVKVGDTLTLSAPTPRGTNNTIDVRLAVVAANMGLLSSWNTFIPNETLRRLYQLNAETTGAVFVYLKDLRTLPQVEARVREALGKAGYTLMDKDPRAFFMKFETVNREGWTGQRLDVTTWEDETSFLQWVITALDWLTRVLIFVLLVIIALGIINTLWIAIRERTREIGTLRAVGMQRLRVLAMFLIEASVLGTAATAAGAVIGVAVCLGLNGLGLKLPAGAQVLLMSDTLHLAIVPLDVLRSVLLISLCTMLISLLPSFLAARLRPVTAMHHVG